jgi:hypothetical protein
LPLSDKTVIRALTVQPAGFMPALWRPEVMPPYLATLHHWCRSLTLLLLSLLAMSPAAADPPGRVGRIASLFGSVHLHRAESGESSTAVLNWPLTSGDVLSTAAGARAEVQIGSNLLQIASGSVLELMQLDDQRVALRLLEGSVIARLPSPEAASEFEFITRDGRFQVREAGRYRFDSDRSTTAGTVYAGALRFSAADSSLDIGAGQRAQFWSEGRTRYQVSAPVNDEFALWSAAREPQRGAAQALLVSPEMTGVGDLDAHGNWYESPEYGAVWFPRALPADWAPYRSGRWVWVDPWGWSWVGDEPWGFAPFHYGRWALFRGAWGWVPGKRVARPVYAPALVAWVGTPAAHRPAHTGGRPAVGWFPLAPREVYIPAYRSSAGHVRQVNAAHVTNINHLTEITVNPQAVAARSRYVHQHLPEAVTAVPEEAMRQRRHVREAALQPAERALLTSQPVQVRAPVAGRDREEVRRQMGQMQPAEERTRPAAGGALPDGQPGRRGDAQATPPVGLSGATAAAALNRPRSAVPPPASANAVSMLPATPPTTVAAPAPRPPADAASPPPPGAALPGHPGGRVRTEAPRDSARRSDPGLLPAAPASPMAPVPSVLPPGQRTDRGGMPAAGPVPERRERSGDSPGRVSAPSALEGRDRRATSPTPISTAVPAMPATGSQQRPVEVPTTSPLHRIDTAGQRAGAPISPPVMAPQRAVAPTSQPVMAPQRVERPPGEAARPVTAVRSERAEPRLPDRAPNGEDLLRQHRRQEARSDQAVAGRVDSPGLAAPARVDAQPPRERPAGAERAPGGSRPNEKRGDPREEIRGRQPGVQ